MNHKILCEFRFVFNVSTWKTNLNKNTKKKNKKQNLKKLKQFKKNMNLITTQSIQSTALELGMNFKINPDLIREMTVLFMTSKPFVWVTTTYIIEVQCTSFVVESPIVQKT